MSLRSLAAIAASGLVMTLAAGPLSPLYAQESTSVDADVAIVREVTTRNMLELRLADMAKKKSANASVKSFAERVQTDHLNMHKQLEALVGQNGQPYRTGIGKMEPQLAEVRQLEKLSGSQFDQQYMASMIRHHQDDVSYFRTNANTARSAQVRTLLTNNLPVLQQHLSMAVQVGNQVGAGVTVASQNPTPPTQTPTPTTQYPAPPTQTQPQIPTQNPQPTATVPAVNDNSPADPKAFKKDAKFVREAIQDNTLEIRLAKVAETKTTDPRVRQLARRVLDDHTAMQGQWIALAKRNGMNLKPSIGPRHMDKVRRMERTSGGDFDKAYPTMLIQSNQDYVEYFQKEGAAARSAQVRTQAASDLTTLRQHLMEAKQVALVHGVDTTAALKARNLSSYKTKK